MLGAIVGDIVGSVYEWNNIKTKDFPLFRKDCFFTDDTVSSNRWVSEFVSETELILSPFHFKVRRLQSSTGALNSPNLLSFTNASCWGGKSISEE